uniref:non-specific serine/threonine protein kinase n=1 Tax=Chromera velia CCMP2878 TaxID=1169474 RepID=A0A0G4HPY8_9ALVE|eukprot:Cvel_1247.t1-p1 / transcript=Cvel_1247.t1 / gene=Cvel_1247 / organism=Chromera_velia_CCMP2878 / gene_product=MAP kinase kinase MKK1/SSP32, putative / transcript_product=MAP kinase kinase MKK1/SSP32, putative / location=Cvel_scaffold41:152995-164309(-) / protein_length=2067 / sequence_SO=supercontig / SO=protein_coding / is_pseudo=false
MGERPGGKATVKFHHGCDLIGAPNSRLVRISGKGNSTPETAVCLSNEKDVLLVPYAATLRCFRAAEVFLHLHGERCKEPKGPREHLETTLGGDTLRPSAEIQLGPDPLGALLQQGVLRSVKEGLRVMQMRLRGDHEVVAVAAEAAVYTGIGEREVNVDRASRGESAVFLLSVQIGTVTLIRKVDVAFGLQPLTDLVFCGLQRLVMLGNFGCMLSSESWPTPASMKDISQLSTRGFLRGNNIACVCAPRSWSACVGAEFILGGGPEGALSIVCWTSQGAVQNARQSEVRVPNLRGNFVALEALPSTRAYTMFAVSSDNSQFFGVLDCVGSLKAVIFRLELRQQNGEMQCVFLSSQIVAEKVYSPAWAPPLGQQRQTQRQTPPRFFLEFVPEWNLFILSSGYQSTVDVILIETDGALGTQLALASRVQGKDATSRGACRGFCLFRSLLPQHELPTFEQTGKNGPVLKGPPMLLVAGSDGVMCTEYLEKTQFEPVLFGGVSVGRLEPKERLSTLLDFPIASQPNQAPHWAAKQAQPFLNMNANVPQQFPPSASAPAHFPPVFFAPAALNGLQGPAPSNVPQNPFQPAFSVPQSNNMPVSPWGATKGPTGHFQLGSGLAARPDAATVDGSRLQSQPSSSSTSSSSTGPAAAGGERAQSFTGTQGPSSSARNPAGSVLFGAGLRTGENIGVPKSVAAPKNVGVPKSVAAPKNVGVPKSAAAPSSSPKAPLFGGAAPSEVTASSTGCAAASKAAAGLIFCPKATAPPEVRSTTSGVSSGDPEVAAAPKCPQASFFPPNGATPPDARTNTGVSSVASKVAAAAAKGPSPFLSSPKAAAPTEARTATPEVAPTRSGTSGFFRGLFSPKAAAPSQDVPLLPTWADLRPSNSSNSSAPMPPPPRLSPVTQSFSNPRGSADSMAAPPRSAPVTQSLSNARAGPEGSPVPKGGGFLGGSGLFGNLFPGPPPPKATERPKQVGLSKSRPKSGRAKITPHPSLDPGGRDAPKGTLWLGKPKGWGLFGPSGALPPSSRPSGVADSQVSPCESDVWEWVSGDSGRTSPVGGAIGAVGGALGVGLHPQEKPRETRMCPRIEEVQELGVRLSSLRSASPEGGEASSSSASVPVKANRVLSGVPPIEWQGVVEYLKEFRRVAEGNEEGGLYGQFLKLAEGIPEALGGVEKALESATAFSEEQQRIKRCVEQANEQEAENGKQGESPVSVDDVVERDRQRAKAAAEIDNSLPSAKKSLDNLDAFLNSQGEALRLEHLQECLMKLEDSVPQSAKAALPEPHFSLDHKPLWSLCEAACSREEKWGEGRKTGIDQVREASDMSMRKLRDSFIAIVGDACKGGSMEEGGTTVDDLCDAFNSAVSAVDAEVLLHEQMEKMQDFDSGEVFAQILAAGREVVRRVQSVVLPGDRLRVAVKDAERAAQRLHEGISLEGSKACEGEGGESGRVRRLDDLRSQLEGLVGLQKELAKDERKIGRLLENAREEEGPSQEEEIERLEKELKRVQEDAQTKNLGPHIARLRAQLLGLASLHFPELLWEGDPFLSSVRLHVKEVAHAALQAAGVLIQGRNRRRDFMEERVISDASPREGRLARLSECRDRKGVWWVLKRYVIGEEDPGAAASRHFYRQAAMLHDLQHSHLVPVVAVWQEGVYGFVQMPRYPGGDLAAWMERRPAEGGRDSGESLRIAEDILLGLAFLHGKEKVHCDVKPSNVFITERGRAVLGDFDGVKDLRGSGGAPGSVASDATVVHVTSKYLAPEHRRRDSAPFLPSSDVFSAGMVLSELLGGGVLDGPRAATAERLTLSMQAEDPTERPTAAALLQSDLFSPEIAETAQCIACREVILRSRGVSCGDAARHFMCCDCINGHVSALARVDNEYADVRARFKGGDCKVLCAQGGCPSPPFSISDLAVYLLPEVMELLEKARREAAEERVRSDLEAEFQRRLRVALVEEGAQKKVREIIDDVLTLKCPGCHQAFIDYDGCAALACSRCPCKFCGYCLRDCGNDAHPHVRHCPSDTSRSGLFPSRPNWERAQRERQRRTVQQIVNSLSREEKTKVLQHLQPLLNERRIRIHI